MYYHFTNKNKKALTLTKLSNICIYPYRIRDFLEELVKYYLTPQHKLKIGLN